MERLEDIAKLERFDNLKFIAKKIVDGFMSGLHKSPYHGFSVEFAEHRPYNNGESLQHLDWKLLARTDKMFVKKYEAETNLRCRFIIDSSSSMLFPFAQKNRENKLAYAVYSTAVLMHLFRKQRDAVALSHFSNKVHFHSPAKTSYSHLEMLYGELTRLINKEALQEETNIVTSLHEIAENTHKRSLIILFSDLLCQYSTEELMDAIQHLKYNKHELLIFYTYDKKIEQNLELGRKPYKLVDMETGERMQVNTDEVKKLYASRMEQLIKELEVRSQQLGVDFTLADINQPFAHIIHQFLIKRNKLY